MKGSHMFWLVITLFIAYLILDYFEINLLYLIGKLIGIVFLGFICAALVYTILVLPFSYISEYDTSCRFTRCNRSPDVTFKNYYKDDECRIYLVELIVLNPIYWIIVAVIELNKFCDKYFTFKL